MNAKIKAQVSLINQKIRTLETVRFMQTLEHQIESESDFLSEEQTLFNMQKKLMQSFNDPTLFESLKKEYEIKFNQLESQPLYVNYRYHLQQVNELIMTIQAQLKTIGEQQ